MAEKEHCVHFSSSSGVGCNNIVVQPLRHGHLNVNLGFLQIHHTYHVEFTVPWNKCVLRPEDKFVTPAIPTGKKNLNCHLIDCNQDRDDLRLKVELSVQSERFLKEEFQITCCESGSPLTVYLNARVFGEDQGTPILRNGIRSVGRKEHKTASTSTSSRKHMTVTTLATVSADNSGSGSGGVATTSASSEQIQSDSDNSD